jgi:hypothetical protein
MSDVSPKTKLRLAERPWARLLFFGVMLLLVGAALFINYDSHRPRFVALEIDGRTRLTAEIADTAAKRERGLSGHEALGPGEGMLFVFAAPGRQVFWMKGMSFPIDIIWLLGEEVVDLVTDVPPPAHGVADSALPSYASRVPADRVLEVPAGFAAANGLRIGSQIRAVVDTESGVR